MLSWGVGLGWEAVVWKLGAWEQALMLSRRM